MMNRVAHNVDSVFKPLAPSKRSAPGVRSLDLAAELMVQALTYCAADWREDILGDALAHLRRRHCELSDRDIDALVAAIRARVEPGNFGRCAVGLSLMT